MKSFISILLLIALFLASASAQSQAPIEVPTNLKPYEKPDIKTLLPPGFEAEVQKMISLNEGVEPTTALLITQEQPNNLLTM
jgi:hypothetical protein